MFGPMSFVHRRLWPLLPRGLRRSALFYATARAAPRPAPDTRAALPIVVAGALRTLSGLGESARLCHDALLAAGLPVYGIDLTAGLMQPDDHPGWSFADGRSLEGPGTIILHVNSPLVALAMLCLGPRVIEHKRIVGYWAWELPEVPAEWRNGVQFVHEIWVPSRFTAAAVEPIAGGRPVRIMAHPVAVRLGAPTAGRRREGQPFTVLTIFNTASGFTRKNPLAAIAAFRRAFDGDTGARLVVKTLNVSSSPQAAELVRAASPCGNVVVIADPMTTSEIIGLYTDADVLLSLHRSEGFGLTLAEAMLQGVPVVATGWSGNADFLTQETGIPIPCRLVPAQDPQGTYQHPGMRWAEPDIDAAAAALRRLRDAPALRARLGCAGAKFAADTWSAHMYAGAVRAQLGVQ